MNRKVNTILCPSPTVVHHASMDPCISVGDGGDASRRYLYTPVSITQADNECRLEGGKTHEIFHFLSKKVGGRVPPPSPTDLRPCSYSTACGLETAAISELKQHNRQVYEDNWTRRTAGVNRVERRKMKDISEEVETRACIVGRRAG